MAQSLEQAIDALQGNMDDAAILGAASRIMSQQRLPGRRPAPSLLTPEQQRSASRLTGGFAAGGVPTMGLRRQVAPLGEVTFTATSGTQLTLDTTPTKVLIGKKLVVSVTRTGASATASVNLGAFIIGSINQFVTNANAPADLFAPEVQGNNIDFDQAAAGVPIQAVINLAGTALAGADTIRVSIGLIAETIG